MPVESKPSENPELIEQQKEKQRGGEIDSGNRPGNKTEVDKAEADDLTLPRGEFRKNEDQEPSEIDQKGEAINSKKTSGPRGSDDTGDWADRSAKEQEKLLRG